jgi:RNA polymerase primary sigma factor
MKKTIIFSETTTFRSEELAAYMRDCNRYKVMDNDQVVAAIANGHKEAVINANLKLVISIAKGYQGQGLTLEDLIQEGNIGLCEAVNRYDASRGTMFTTCALGWIRKAITEALTNKGRVVRMPKHAIGGSYIAVSMDAPIGGDDEGNEKCMLDTFAADSRTDSHTDVEAARHTIAALMNGLDEREKQIICKLFGIGTREHTQYELSLQYHCTEERIRQIKIAALEKMRQLA